MLKNWINRRFYRIWKKNYFLFIRVKCHILYFKTERFGGKPFFLGCAPAAYYNIFPINNAYTEPKWWAPCICLCKAVGMLTHAFEWDSTIRVKPPLDATVVSIYVSLETCGIVLRTKLASRWQSGVNGLPFQILWRAGCFVG